MGKDLKGKELGNGFSQRKNGRYCARHVNRFGVRECVYGDSLKEVKNKISTVISEDIMRKNVIDEKITLDEWYKKWMEIYKMPVIRLNTKRHYEHIYTTKISPTLGAEKLINVTKLKITSLYNKLKDSGYQWETLNKVKILLTDMFNRALEDEFVVRNPAKGTRLPINKPKLITKALTVIDQDDFFECGSGTFYNNLFIVAINTGLRPGELFALTENDLDFKKKTIHVSKNLLYQNLDGDDKKTFHLGLPKTQSSDRKVPMNALCEKALLKQIILHKILYKKSLYKNSLQYPDLLFTTKFCTPLNSIVYNAAIDKIVEEINSTRDELDYMEKISGHTFRHTFATRCFEANISPKTVQCYLGHASLKMTMDLYTDVLDEKKHDDMEKFEKTIHINAPNIEQYAVSKIIEFCG